MESTQEGQKPEVNLPLAPEQINNPVLPPDIGDFFAKMERGSPNPQKPDTKPEQKPEAKVTQKQESVENDDIGDDDDLSDPFLKNIIGEEEEPEPKKADKPEAKKVDKKADEKSDDDKLPELPEGDLKGDDAAKAVREAFATQRKKLTAKIATLEKQVAERTGGEAPPEVTEKLTRYETENKQLKAQLEEQEKFVQLASLESSKVFRETVKAPIEGIKGDIVRISQDNGGPEAGVSATDIWVAIQKGDRVALNSILVNLSEADKIEVISLEKDYKTIRAAEQALRQNAKVAQEEFERSNQEKQAALTRQFKDVYDKSFEAALGNVRTAASHLFKEVDGADDWNAQVKQANERIAQFKEIHPGQLSTGDIATLLANHVAGGLLKFENDKLRAEVRRLSDRIRQRRANSPGAGAGSGGGGGKAQATSGPAKMPTPEEFIASRGNR